MSEGPRKLELTADKLPYGCEATAGLSNGARGWSVLPTAGRDGKARLASRWLPYWWKARAIVNQKRGD